MTWRSPIDHLTERLASGQNHKLTKDLSPIAPTKIGLPRFMDLTWPVTLGIFALVIVPFDEALVAVINPDNPIPWLDDFANFLDRWSTRLELLVLLSFFFLSILWRRLHSERKPLFAFITAWFVGELIVGVLKRVTGRPRPGHLDGMQDQLRVLYENLDYKSFPSGHTSMAVMVAVFVTVWRPKKWYVPLTWVAAFLIGTGRIYIGAHHPSDVLAGAAIGWFVMCAAWKIATPGTGLYTVIYPPKKIAGLVVLTWILALGWLLQDAPILRDSLTGAHLDDWRMPSAGFLAILFEPFVGPARKLSSLPDMMNVGMWGAIWFGAAAILYFLRCRTRSLKLIGSIACLGFLWGYLSIAGHPGVGGKPEIKDGPAMWAFDLQSHLDDPYDGGVSLAEGLDRFQKLGYEIVVPTWHNKWAQGHLWTSGDNWGPIDLFGAEWSGGDPAANSLHLLVYNRRKKPANLSEISDPAVLIAEVHKAGGVVIGSHFWRGDSSEMPSLGDLVDMGIDGFEVAGRNEEAKPKSLDRLENIRLQVAAKNLVGLGNSDFHGKRSWNHVWNLVKRDDIAASADGVWQILKSQSADHQVVALHSDPRGGILSPIHAAVRYGRELPILGRASWLFWIVLVGLTLWPRRKKAEATTVD
ncbi:MAG: membrane-associated phospholipid phosphatase [Planctomycetota bacterium]